MYQLDFLHNFGLFKFRNQQLLSVEANPVSTRPGSLAGSHSTGRRLFRSAGGIPHVLQGDTKMPGAVTILVGPESQPVPMAKSGPAGELFFPTLPSYPGFMGLNFGSFTSLLMASNHSSTGIPMRSCSGGIPVTQVARRGPSSNSTITAA